MTRFTIHANSLTSNEINASIHNTFEEVLAYCQAVCDFNMTGVSVKIIDRVKRSVIYDGPMDYKALTALKSSEKGD
jgi:uncharacterized protein YerC